MSSPRDSQAPFADPYRSPAVASKPAAPPGQVQYLRAWTFAFDNPQWVVTVLFLIVAQFVPILGQLVILGYQFAVVEGLHRSGGQTYPEFDLDRFADYLVRGVWVLAVVLLASLLLAPVFFVLIFLPMFALIAASGGDDEAAVALLAVGMPLLFLAMILLSALVNVLLTPMLLRAGLAQDFGAAFNFDWIKSFISKTWKEMILGMLFLMVSSMAAALAGFLLFCIGVYPATALIFLAQAYMNFQYYELFLLRGGEPVPLKNPAQQGW